MHNELVQAELARHSAALEQKSRISQAYVLNTLVASVERSLRGQPILDKRKQPLGVYQDGLFVPILRINETAVQRGCHILGRFLGLGVIRHELTGKDGGPIQLDETSEHERARRIAFTLGRGLRLIQGGKPLPTTSVLHQQQPKAGDDNDSDS